MIFRAFIISAVCSNMLKESKLMMKTVKIMWIEKYEICKKKKIFYLWNAKNLEFLETFIIYNAPNVPNPYKYLSDLPHEKFLGTLNQNKWGQFLKIQKICYGNKFWGICTNVSKIMTQKSQGQSKWPFKPSLILWSLISQCKIIIWRLL